MLTLRSYPFWVHPEMKERINIQVMKELFKKILEKLPWVIESYSFGHEVTCIFLF